MNDADIKAAAARLSGHVTERKIIYGLVAALVLYGAGFWNGTRIGSGRGEAIKRQLEGTLTQKEQAIVAGNAAIGKVQTELKTSKDVEAQLKADNADLSGRAEALQHSYNLMAGQYASLSAWVQTTLKNGKTGDLPPDVAASKVAECGACKGAIAFGSPAFARCSWTDYAGARNGAPGFANLDLNLGVKINTVTLRQKPQDGALEAVLGDVFLTDSAGVVLAKGRLDEHSRVFTAAPSTGDLYRRRIWLQGAAGTQGARLSFLTQKGIRPFGWGAGATRDWTGKWGAEALLSFQIR